MPLRQNLVPRLDARHQGVRQADIQKDESRKNWISNVVRFILNHPDMDKLLEDLQNNCNREYTPLGRFARECPKCVHLSRNSSCQPHFKLCSGNCGVPTYSIHRSSFSLSILY